MQLDKKRRHKTKMCTLSSTEVIILSLKDMADSFLYLSCQTYNDLKPFTNVVCVYPKPDILYSSVLQASVVVQNQLKTCQWATLLHRVKCSFALKAMATVVWYGSACEICWQKEKKIENHQPHPLIIPYTLKRTAIQLQMGSFGVSCLHYLTILSSHSTKVLFELPVSKKDLIVNCLIKKETFWIS